MCSWVQLGLPVSCSSVPGVPAFPHRGRAAGYLVAWQGLWRGELLPGDKGQSWLAVCKDCWPPTAPPFVIASCTVAGSIGTVPLLAEELKQCLFSCFGPLLDGLLMLTGDWTLRQKSLLHPAFLGHGAFWDQMVSPHQEIRIPELCFWIFFCPVVHTVLLRKG